MASGSAISGIGRLMLSAASDEETFGPAGTRYFSQHYPEVFGGTCLNVEPNSRFHPLPVRRGLRRESFWRDSCKPVRSEGLRTAI